MFNGAALKVPKRVCKRMTYQTTLSGPALCAGVGLHTGERARLAFKPAEANTGIVFVRTDVSSAERVIIADGRHVTTTQLGTVGTMREMVVCAPVRDQYPRRSLISGGTLVACCFVQVPSLSGATWKVPTSLDRIHS